jgi:hypothetical protein
MTEWLTAARRLQPRPGASDRGSERPGRVERVVAAPDCGHAVNPLTVAEQLEGGTIWGLSAALFGKNTVTDGAILETNFDSYPVVRMADAPRIETHLALTGGKKWGGVGEPGAAAIAPAVTKAIFAATGTRIANCRSATPISRVTPEPPPAADPARQSPPLPLRPCRLAATGRQPASARAPARNGARGRSCVA